MKNLSGHEFLMAISYPSTNNEFSIFDVKNFVNYLNPKVHFNSSVNESKGCPKMLPYLEDVSLKENYIDYDSQVSGKYDWSKLITMENNNSFRIGNSFKYNSIDAFVGIYQDIYMSTKMRVKNEWVTTFEEGFKVLSELHSKNGTINKIVCLPSDDIREELAQNDIFLDNIILTAGTDRNIRFLNFGNDFPNINPFNSDYNTMNCYHISNVDRIERNYYYSYSGDCSIIQEESGKYKTDLEDVPGISQIGQAFGIGTFFVVKKKIIQVIRNQSSKMAFQLITMRF